MWLGRVPKGTSMTIPPVAHSRRRLVALRDPLVRELLGNLPLSTLYDLARASPPLLPGVVRVRRRVLIDLSKVEAWIDAGGGGAVGGSDDVE